MENLKQKQKDLYENWLKKRNYKEFTKDGILNYEVWEKTSPKIMFLLKESASDFINIADKNHDIRKGAGHHFWWNICYWKYIINQLHKGNTNLKFFQTTKLPEAKNDYIINDIAYVNIKKKHQNKTKSENADIIQYAKADKELLIKQIDLISPDIVFCDKTTFNAYNILYGKLDKLNNNCYKHNNRLIISYYHPSYFQIKGGRETLFYNLQTILSDNIFEHFKW